MSEIRICDAAFKEDVLLACYDALEAVGFNRYRKQAVDLPLKDGFQCWVGLNTDLRGDFVEVNPFVGIHVTSIEKFWTALKTGKYPARYSRSVATLAKHMGELAPNEAAFRFVTTNNIDGDAKRLALLYATVGLRYAQSIASYEKLLPFLLDRAPMLGGSPERVVACLFLMGRKNDAQLFAREFLGSNRDYFEGFAIPFLTMNTGEVSSPR